MVKSRSISQDKREEKVICLHTQLLFILDSMTDYIHKPIIASIAHLFMPQKRK